MTKENSFAIVDVETTGFSPKKGDKIVEIAIITCDWNGEKLDTYETLVNPNRYVSASHIHGLTGQMVKDAPLVEDIIEDIMYHLQGKTIVGHNISFDLRFICHELYKRTGDIPDINGICTIQLSHFVEPNLPVRKLERICQYYDIDLPQSHSAYSDCSATFDLFNVLRHSYLDNYSVNEFYRNFISPVQFRQKVSPKGISFKRTDATTVTQKETNRLLSLIQRLPVNPSLDINIQQYLDILDKILADRIVTESEAQELFDFATESNISRNQANEIHQEYLRKLTRIYLLDNILSKSEYADLLTVSKLLAIDKDILDKMIEFEKSSIAMNKTAQSETQESNLTGKSVCFTGQLNAKINGEPIERETAQQYAMERGMVIKSGVSKKLDYLVTADPNSLSGKAKKARDIGTTIIAESVFWNMLGISVE